MIILSLCFDFLLGFILHQTRPWTMQFDNPHISDLIRYTIGLVGYIIIAPFNVLYVVSKNKNGSRWRAYENTVVGLLLTALAYGAGVVVGFIADTE